MTRCYGYGSTKASSSEKIKKDSDGSKTSSVPDGILFSLITITDTEERDSCAYIGPRVHVGVDVKLKSPQFDVNANDIGPICLITYGPVSYLCVVQVVEAMHPPLIVQP